MATLQRSIVRVVLLSAGLLWGCPSAGVDNPPPDPLRTDAAVDAGPGKDAEPAADAEPNADAAAPDAEPVDTGFVLRSGNFAPATGSAGSPDHALRGGFRPSSGGAAASDRHKLRGSIGTLSR